MKLAILIVFVVGLVIQVHGKMINHNQQMHYFFFFFLIFGVISSPLCITMYPYEMLKPVRKRKTMIKRKKLYKIMVVYKSVL